VPISAVDSEQDWSNLLMIAKASSSAEIGKTQESLQFGPGQLSQHWQLISDFLPISFSPP